MLKKVGVGIGVLMVFGVISSAMGGEETAPATDTTAAVAEAEESTDESVDEEPAEDTETAEEEPQAKPKPKPAAPAAVKVEASQIVKEFEDNELAADTKYKGKDLRVSGKVTKIDTDMWDDEKYILSLGKGKWDFLTVNCHDMSTDELSTLKVGQTVTVVGTFDDGGDLGVEVSDCRLA